VLCIRGQALAPVAFRDAMARFGTSMLRKQLARTPKPWRQGDIVIWDNRCAMHKANYAEGERRRRHRVIVAGTVPVRSGDAREAADLVRRSPQRAGVVAQT
jgi:hypothetical protein